MTRSPPAPRCWSWAGVALGALLWLLAYPPFALLLPAFVALVPFILFLERAARGASLRDLAAGGAAFGFAASMVLLHWVPVALWRFTPWAILLGVVLVTMVAAGWVGVALVTVTIWRRTPGIPRWLVFALCWTAWEAIRARLGPIAFPWLGLSASLVETPVLIQAADIVGGAGLTLWLAAINAALAGAWVGHGRPGRVIGAVVASAVGLTAYGLYRYAEIPLDHAGRVVVVQPDVPATISWYSAGDSLVAALDRQTRDAVGHGSVDLVIWPEVAVPGVLAEHGGWGDRIGALVDAIDTQLIFGALDRTAPARTFNAALSWQPGERRSHVVYRKRRLVPVTERSLLGLGVTTPGRAEAVGFSAGSDASPIASPLGPIGIAICFESIFPDLARRYRRAGATVLVNLTNDVWMGPTAGPAQHAAHLRLRAVETRMGVVQASNSGVSQVVDPLGRVVAEAARGRRTTVEADVYTTAAVAPVAAYGDWIGVGLVLLVLLLGGWAATRRGRYSAAMPR